MRYIKVIVLAWIFTFPGLSQNNRLLILTDIGGDPDDKQSLVRLMVYSNEFDIEGLICSASGTPGELDEAVVRPDLIKEVINGYGKVYMNLLRHDSDFPSPDYLLSVVRRGNPERGWANVGEGHDTEGSDWIIRAADKKDNRPLNICIFGGQTDLAQALWKVKKTRPEKDYRSFISAIRIYDINDQDKIFENIFSEHPALFYILAKAPEGVDKREGAYRGVYYGGDESLTSMAWIKENVLENHGPLGELYPVKTWTAPNPHGVMKEGDTPSWFYFFKNGLNIPDHPGYGGWGGRFVRNARGYYSDAQDTYLGEKNARATVYRWRDEFQRDWAARMDWCVNEYSKSNHSPLVVVNNSPGTELLVIRSAKGNTIELDAGASSDPDGNSVFYEWMVYPDTENLSGEVEIKAENGRASVKLPSISKGKTLHLVLKVTDDGTPNLTSYKRIDILF
jgi:hypothetical protein